MGQGYSSLLRNIELSTTITSAAVKPCLTVLMRYARVCEASFMLIYRCVYICNNLYAKRIHGNRPILVRAKFNIISKEIKIRFIQGNYFAL